jgi:DNA modification methylase
MTLMLGNCLDTLKTLPDSSVDSVVTDSPYGLKFMGKKWDADVPSEEIWREVLRVLKPGGHLLSFFGTRTYHRGVVRIEDAGFEIRDQLAWIYGSGFPKSHDVSKGIDKAAGAKREVVGLKVFANGQTYQGGELSGRAGMMSEGKPRGPALETAPSTPEAKQWQGFGTALKPAQEPIVLARKPLIGTVAQNYLEHGVGGLNIDASRIDGVPTYFPKPGEYPNSNGVYPRTSSTREAVPSHLGRWPANVLFDEHAASVLDEQSGTLKSGKPSGVKTSKGFEGGFGNGIAVTGFGDSGGASRFFYCAKASKRERNAGLEGMPLVTARSGIGGGQVPVDDQGNERNRFEVTQANHHPTVKPIALMRYLIKLITPPGGIVLDPFMGSGSTGVAAKSLGFRFIGCELSEEYLAIATKRIEHHEAVI